MSKNKVKPEEKQTHMIKISYDKKLKDDTKDTLEYLNNGSFLYITENIWMKMMMNMYCEFVLSWTEVGKGFVSLSSRDRFLNQHGGYNYTSNCIFISDTLYNKINRSILHVQSLIMKNKEIKKYKKQILNKITRGNFAREALKWANEFVRKNNSVDAFRPGAKR